MFYASFTPFSSAVCGITAVHIVLTLGNNEVITTATHAPPNRFAVELYASTSMATAIIEDATGQAISSRVKVFPLLNLRLASYLKLRSTTASKFL